MKVLIVADRGWPKQKEIEDMLEDIWEGYSLDEIIILRRLIPNLESYDSFIKWLLHWIYDKAIGCRIIISNYRPSEFEFLYEVTDLLKEINQVIIVYDPTVKNRGNDDVISQVRMLCRKEQITTRLIYALIK